MTPGWGGHRGVPADRPPCPQVPGAPARQGVRLPALLRRAAAGFRLPALAAAQLLGRGGTPRERGPPPTLPSRAPSPPGYRRRPVLGSPPPGPARPFPRALRGAAGLRALHAPLPEREEDPPPHPGAQPGGSLQVPPSTKLGGGGAPSPNRGSPNRGEPPLQTEGLPLASRCRGARGTHGEESGPWHSALKLTEGQSSALFPSLPSFLIKKGTQSPIQYPRCCSFLPGATQPPTSGDAEFLEVFGSAVACPVLLPAFDPSVLEGAEPLSVRCS